MGDDILFDADANQLKKWRETPDEERQDRLALHVIKIHNRLAEGDVAMEQIQDTVEDHEERITDNEQKIGKVKTKSRTRIDTIKLLFLILTFATMALIGILGLVT